jgi:orotate phosphoribosyltransferase
MIYQTELCNLKDPLYADFFTNLITTCTKTSEWTLSSGAPSTVFFDIDAYMSDPINTLELSKLISKKIKELMDANYEFDKIAFIEKIDGTVGLITLFSSIMTEINKPSIIIRPKKRLIKNAIKGSIGRGERILIINDVATSGKTIFNAAEIVWANGGKTPYAFVIIDRLQGGTENLSRKGITLFSLTSTKSINTNISTKVGKEFKISEPVFKDFGGKAITRVG